MQYFYLLIKFCHEPGVIGIEFRSGSMETQTVHSHEILFDFHYFWSDSFTVTDVVDNTNLSRKCRCLLYLYNKNDRDRSFQFQSWRAVDILRRTFHHIFSRINLQYL